ncbi:enkurin domain-containing protein 1 isoform X3 [Lemur catta]|nr:enkurin domain-containing protein 1 isoform X3 [Lemur catta]
MAARSQCIFDGCLGGRVGPEGLDPWPPALTGRLAGRESDGPAGKRGWWPCVNPQLNYNPQKPLRQGYQPLTSGRKPVLPGNNNSRRWRQSCSSEPLPERCGGGAASGKGSGLGSEEASAGCAPRAGGDREWKARSGSGSREEAWGRGRGSGVGGAPPARSRCTAIGRDMCEGPSRISGPIPPDPTLCPDYYRRPASAQGRLEGNALKLDLLTSDRDLDAIPPRGPRIGPGAREILEHGQRGVVGVLLQLGDISLGPGPSLKRKGPKDHEKENLRRIREIQRRFREQERSREQGQPRPLKALWRSPKYDKVESQVKAQLQKPGPASGTESTHFLRAHSPCGPGLPPPRVPGSQLTPPGPKAKGPGPGVDFISRNVQAARKAPRRHSRSLQVLAQVLEQQRQAQEHYNATQKGHVPR